MITISIPTPIKNNPYIKNICKNKGKIDNNNIKNTKMNTAATVSPNKISGKLPIKFEKNTDTKIVANRT